ncbi:hypothetical protein D3C72_905490 [compost metagenome]
MDDDLCGAKPPQGASVELLIGETVEGGQILEVNRAKSVLIAHEERDGRQALHAIDDLIGPVVVLVEIEGGQRDSEEDGLDQTGALSDLPDVLALEIRREIDVPIFDLIDDVAEREIFRGDADLGGIPRLDVLAAATGVFYVDLKLDVWRRILALEFIHV